MAKMENVVLLDVKTIDAVKNVQELKDNISALKSNLNQLDIGSAEYQDTLKELRVNQNALKDAMYGTSASLEDVTTSAQGLGTSYNALVHQMAKLKDEFRSTTDEVRRAQLGTQIYDINQQLKDLDSLQGNFQRNVGDYANSIKSVLSDIPQYADPVKKSLKGVSDTMGLMSKNPLIGIVAILFPLLQKIADALGENESAVAAIDKAMQSLKPIMNVFSAIIEKLGEFLADIIGKVTEFIGEHGLIQKIITGVMGVGNAIIQYIIAPFKGVIAAIKVFKEQGVHGIVDAGKAYAEAMKEGFSFKKNFETGREAGEGLVAGVKSKKKEVVAAVSSAISEGVEEGLTMAAFEKALAQSERINADRIAKTRAANEEIAQLLKDMDEEVTADIDGIFASDMKAQQEWLAEQKKTAQAKEEMLNSMVSTTSSILSTLADLYEEDAENNQASARKAKALRAASGIVDTISGAIAAYMQSVGSIPPPYGQIVGAAQAAAVTATGMANVAKIRSTNLGGSSSASASFAAAPSLSTPVPQTTLVNSASQDALLNRLAEDQKVYILQSDIQASLAQSQVRVAEASF